jgi:hypothetical protein
MHAPFALMADLRDDGDLRAVPGSRARDVISTSPEAISGPRARRACGRVRVRSDAVICAGLEPFDTDVA